MLAWLLNLGFAGSGAAEPEVVVPEGVSIHARPMVAIVTAKGAPNEVTAKASVWVLNAVR